MQHRYYFRTTRDDGIDNDESGESDGFDPYCIEVIGQALCAQYWSGSYCIDRSGLSSDGLAECVSGRLISFSRTPSSMYGTQCVHSGTNDYFSPIGAPVIITCQYGKDLVTEQCLHPPDT